MTLRNKYLTLILIIIVGLLAYSNTFSVPFQFDDDAYVVNNPMIRTFHYLFDPPAVSSLTLQSPLSVPPALRFAFTTRILGYLSFAVNYRLNGLNVAGYHVVNLAIHIMNGILVYLLLSLTLRTPFMRGKESGVRSKASEGGPSHLTPYASRLTEFFALFAALLFVSHPIQTQAVTYISSRFALLATFFFLLSLYSYIRSRTSSPGYGRKAWYTAALISAVAAMLSKEFTATLPVVVALYEITFLSGTRGEKTRALAPFAATLLIIPALVFVQQGSLNALDSTMRTITAADVTNISRTHYLLTQFRVIVRYLRLLLLPVGQNVDHDISVYASLFDMPVFLSFLLLFALFATGVYLFVLSRREKGNPELRLASFGIFWFFITLSVESSIIPLGELVAEYRMYLPSVGMITAASSLAAYFLRKSGGSLRQGVVYGVVAAMVLMLGIGTYLRNTVWASEISLWEDAARKSPMKLRPHQNLGTNYMMKGRLEDAERELLTALRLAPNDYEVHNNLGILYKAKGDYARAVREFLTVSRLSPSDPMAHYNLGNIRLMQGDLQGAADAYLASIRLAPDYDEAHNNLGIVYAKSGRCDKAVIEFRLAIGLNPENRKAGENLKACEKKLTVR